MSTPVPHITVEQRHIEQATASFANNQALCTICKIALAEQHLITADEARALGAGKAEYRYRGSYTSWRWQNWITCQNSYESSNSTWEVQYRAIKQPQSSVAEEAAKPQAGVVGNSAIKQPEPVETVGVYCGNIKIFDMPVEPHAELKAMYAQQVKDGTLDDFVWECKYEGYYDWSVVSMSLGFGAQPKQYRCTPKPTCQIRNDDTGELKTMTRDAAQKLQAELGDTVEWKHTNMWIPPNPESAFACEGIYTYKRKANLVKLDGELMTREAAIAKWESKKDTCDVYCWTDSSPSWDKNPNACYGDFTGINDVAGIEYQLRKKPAQPKVHLTVEGEQPQEVTQAEAQAIWEGLKPTHEIYYRHSQLLWDKLVGNIFSLPANRNLQYELRLKPQVKLTIDDNPAKMLTPAQCQAERLARIDTHDVECSTKRTPEFEALLNVPIWTKFDAEFECQYRLIHKQPKLIPLDWKTVPVGVAVKPKSDPMIWLLHGRNRIGQAVLSNKGSDTCDTFCAEFESLELAPAPKQPWIAIQDENPPAADVAIQLGKLGFDVITSGERYRITGLAEGWVLK